MEYCSANKQLTDTNNNTGNFDSIMLHERTQTQKLHPVGVHLFDILETGKLKGQE
jgi:hypothetical protein